MKQIIRLTESDLHRIIKESVTRLIKEAEDENIPSAEEQWNEYLEMQGLKPDTMTTDEFIEKLSKYKAPIRRYRPVDVDWKPESMFQRDNGTNRLERCAATDPQYTYARNNSRYNGSKYYDPNNPSIDGDDSLPEDWK